MKKIVRKQKRYDCDFYTKYGDIPYRTSLNMTWEQVKEAKENAKLIGEKVIHSYSHTEEYVYYVR